MYAPNYGNPNPNANPGAFNGAQLPLNPQQQQQHNMMFNPQQYGSPYGQSNGMPMGANGAAMMQNGGMAQMAAAPPQNNVTAGMPQYQTPYTSSPYGASIPTATSGQPHQQFMPGGAPNFNMNPQGMPNMHPQQRAMQPPPQSNTPQRPAPYNMPPQSNTPTHAHPQFAPPQHPQQHHTPQQAPHLATQQPPQQAAPAQGQQKTPQTPNFPPPLSPASESREKERVTLLLDINRDLLMELMRISQEQAEKKKENAEDKGEKSVQQKSYLECMRRLQANLAYLAAIADRSHKPLSQIPPHPAWMSAPSMPESPKNPGDSPIDAASTIPALQESYRKLHALFPGVDPKREPPMQGAQGQKPAAGGQGQGQGPQPQGQPTGMNNQGMGGMGGGQMGGMNNMAGMNQIPRPKSSQMQGGPVGQMNPQQGMGVGIGGPMAMSMSMPPSQPPQGPR